MDVLDGGVRSKLSTSMITSLKFSPRQLVSASILLHTLRAMSTESLDVSSGCVPSRRTRMTLHASCDMTAPFVELHLIHHVSARRVACENECVNTKTRGLSSWGGLPPVALAIPTNKVLL